MTHYKKRGHSSPQRGRHVGKRSLGSWKRKDLHAVIFLYISYVFYYQNRQIVKYQICGFKGLQVHQVKHSFFFKS